jgi:hypothetical protein
MFCVLQQAIQHVRRFSRRHHFDTIEHPLLIGEVGVEAEAWIARVAGIHVTAALPRLAERKNCVSEDEVVPSPQMAAIGSALVGVGDSGQGLGADVDVRGPDQLVAAI